MATTTGHIKAIISADNSQYMAVSKRTRQDAKTLKRDIEQQKPKIDADSRPFLEAIKRASKAYAASNAGMLAGGLTLGTALAGIPVLLTAIAAVAQSSNEDVRQSYMSLGDDITDVMQASTEPLRDELISIAGRVSGAVRDMQSDLTEMSEAAGPGILMLTDGILGLAKNALPGMKTAVQQSGSVMAGLNSLLEQTGEGASELFENMSEGAPAAGRMLGDFGGIAQDALGTVGSLLALLSNEGAPAFTALRVALDAATDVGLDLAEGTFPALASSGGTLLGTVTSLLRVLEPMAPLLGTIGGVALSAAAGYRVFGMAGELVSRFGDRVQGAADKAGNAGTRVRALGSGISALGGYGAAAGALLMAFNAALDMAAGNVDELAAKLMLGGNAALQASGKLAANDAVVKAASNGWINYSQVLGWFVPTSKDASDAVQKQRDSMTSLQRAQADVTKAQNDYLLATERHGPASEEAAAASAVLRHNQGRLRDVQIQAADATKSLTTRLMEQQLLSLGLANDNLALRMATTAYEQAQRNLNETLKTHAVGTLEATSASQQLEQAALRVIQAASQEALSHYANKESVEAQTAATVASNGKLLELAASMQGPLPIALQQMIANMDNATLASFGATQAIDGTNNAVIRLPSGKEITISARDYANSVINGVRQNAEALDGSWFDIFIKANYSTSGVEPFPGMLPGLQPIQKNSGGWVPGDGPDRDSVPAVLTPKEFVVNRRAAAKYAPWLEAINKAAGGDIKMPTPMLASAPMPSLGAPVQAAAQAVSRSTGDALGMVSGGKTVNRYYNITLNEIKSMPSKEWFRNTLEDVDRGITI